MNRDRTFLVTALVVLGLSTTACGQQAAEAARDEPAVVEDIDGTELKRITLTAHAAERLDIQTAAVESTQDGGDVRLSVPYGAVVWDADGTTWAYTMPDELVFVRAPITVERVEGQDRAILLDGPDAGTMVVVVGAAELWGTEHGVGGAGH